MKMRPMPVATTGGDLYTWPVTPITNPSTMSAMNGTGEGVNAASGTAENLSLPLPMAIAPESIDDVDAGLRSVGYLPGESTALVAYLAARLGKPVLVEGPAGVGKTELAKALARYLDRTLVRLQCYEGLDEAKALYEWNYRKQLLRIQAEASGTGWDAVQDDIFGEEFLLARPLHDTRSPPRSRSSC